MSTAFYKAKDGTRYPVVEASYDSLVTVRREDVNRSVIGDPFNCAIATAAKRLPFVIEAYVGSGSVAYLVLKGVGDSEARAVRFKVRKAAKRLRDDFDTNKALRSQTVVLGAMPQHFSAAVQRAVATKHRERLKSGLETKKLPIRTTRLERIGATKRVSPPIIKTAAEPKAKKA